MLRRWRQDDIPRTSIVSLGRTISQLQLDQKLNFVTWVFHTQPHLPIKFLTTSIW
uniref:Uncharacterized protein n=1 Tax=Strigamia maritima TaxID=126957 RepID=T1JLY2_STRMM